MDWPSRVGEQLTLSLDDVRSQSLEPWEGRSPRELTKAWKTFKLSAIPPGGSASKRDVRGSAQDKGCSDPEQLLLFLEVKPHE